MDFAYVFYAKQYYNNKNENSFWVIILRPCQEQVTRTEYKVYSVTQWQLMHHRVIHIWQGGRRRCLYHRKRIVVSMPRR